MCRWSGAARAELRAEKSSGMPENVLSTEAASHPWFARLRERSCPTAATSASSTTASSISIAERSSATIIAREDETSDGVTMIEFARERRRHAAHSRRQPPSRDHRPRAHHDRARREARARRSVASRGTASAPKRCAISSPQLERESRLTSEYTLLGPLRHHLGALIAERCEAAIA